MPKTTKTKYVLEIIGWMLVIVGALCLLGGFYWLMIFHPSVVLFLLLFLVANLLRLEWNKQN